MFRSSGKTMKWASLLKDIKEKVGFSQSSPLSSPTSTASASVESSPSDRHAFAPSPSRDKHELELDFKRFWEEFRSSSSEKEKEAALNMAVDVFCRLVKQQANVVHLVTTLVEAHIFSFVVGRAFVTDVEKLKISSRTRSLHVVEVVNFFSEVAKDGTSPGSNLLYAVEVLVTGPIDKQPLLDSGILCCLIHILNALLAPDDANKRQPTVYSEGSISSKKGYDGDATQARRLELIVWAPTREKAIERMKRALNDTVITGIPTTIEYHKLILDIEDFRNGKIDTAFIPKHENELAEPQKMVLSTSAKELAGTSV